METLNDLQTKIARLKGLKGEERQHLLRECAEEMHTLFKSWGYLTIGKETIEAVFEGLKDESARFQRQIKHEAIAFLIANNKIKEFEFYKNSPYYAIRRLYSYDFNSWAVLKNKRACVSDGNMSIERGNTAVKVKSYKLL